MIHYAVYVSDDNGWLDGCPDSESVFFGGSHAGTFVHAGLGGIYPVGHVEVIGHSAALAELDRLETSGDWTAPQEINPEREETRPSYAIRKLWPRPRLLGPLAQSAALGAPRSDS